MDPRLSSYPFSLNSHGFLEYMHALEELLNSITAHVSVMKTTIKTLRNKTSQAPAGGLLTTAITEASGLL